MVQKKIKLVKLKILSPEQRSQLHTLFIDIIKCLVSFVGICKIVSYIPMLYTRIAVQEPKARPHNFCAKLTAINETFSF